MSVALSVVLAGCAGVDFDAMRRDHADSFAAELAEKTDTAISEGVELSLADCIRIALENNLDVSLARISQRLATLDKQIAFANFLPQIDAQLIYQSSDVQQAIGHNGVYNTMSDRTVTRATLGAQQVIFAPETWFIYQAYKKGEGINALLARRTRDLIRLQVTTLYYAGLSLERSVEAQAVALEQVEAMRHETAALVREGLALDSDLQQIEAMRLARQSRMDDTTRQLHRTRAELLDAMGLSPAAAYATYFSLKPEAASQPDTRDLPEQILAAMINRPELAMADRVIEIRADQVKIAIAAFLPRLVGFSDLTHSTDSYLKYANVWSYGLSATMSLFDGFATIGEYKAARQRREQAVIEREQQCMKIMLEVIQARNQYALALQQHEVAVQQLESSRLQYDQAQARWREGMLVGSERLEAAALYETAVAGEAVAGFQLQVAAATLRDVLGETSEGTERDQVSQ